MVERTLKIFILLVVSFLFTNISETAAQQILKNLVIRQACLNKTTPEKSWIEIYNPTVKELVLERFRLSHLRTINILPTSVNKQGGIPVGAGKSVILCADENIFKSAYGKELNIINVKWLARITAGGFIVATTKGADVTKGSFVRYGKAGYSKEIAKYAGSQVVGFSDEGKSYTREVKKDGDGITLLDFKESDANPGRLNN